MDKMKCKMCDDSKEIKIEKARTMGYTLTDGEVLDEHLVSCPECSDKMNVLVLTCMNRKHTDRQHIGTLERLEKYCNITIYNGDDLEPYKNSTFDNNLYQIVKSHNPDIVICYASLGFSESVTPFKDISRCKICIETDYHNMFGKEEWYRDNGFEYIFQRNGNDSSEIGIPSVWWPWSADEHEFYPVNEPRRNIIGFAGSSAHELYVIRKKAIEILTKNNLLENRKKTIMGSEMSDGMWKGEWSDQGKYQEYLRSITGLLTSTENRGPFAKTFEAMASNTVVLSSPVLNKELLFGNKKCYFEYKEDCSNIVEMAKIILNNPRWVEEVMMNAKEMFLERHTTEKRVKELYDNLVLILEGKEPVRKWGI